MHMPIRMSIHMFMHMSVHIMKVSSLVGKEESSSVERYTLPFDDMESEHSVFRIDKPNATLDVVAERVFFTASACADGESRWACAELRGI